MKRIFTELPEEQQNGCRVIESQCRQLLTQQNLTIDALYWDDMDFRECSLTLKQGGRIFRKKFGKLALVNTQDPYTANTIRVRLMMLINKIKFFQGAQ